MIRYMLSRLQSSSARQNQKTSGRKKSIQNSCAERGAAGDMERNKGAAKSGSIFLQRIRIAVKINDLFASFTAAFHDGLTAFGKSVIADRGMDHQNQDDHSGDADDPEEDRVYI